MVRLELTDDEAKELSIDLQQTLTGMEREIAGTDARDYRLELHKRERVLKDVMNRLRTQAV